jgi:MFS family permease
MFIVFRFWSGAGGNLLSATVPIWMAEVVPAKNRGFLVDMHGAMYAFGYCAAAWVGYGFFFLNSSDSWRAPFGMFSDVLVRLCVNADYLAIQCLPPLILLAGIYYLPESPRWLLMQDRHEEARKILQRFHSKEEAEVEYIQIDAQMRIDKTMDTSYLNMIRKPSYRKRLFLTVACTGFNQFSGILVITSELSTPQTEED